MGKKFVLWGAIAFLIFFIAFRPSMAADVFKSMGDGVIDVARGFGDFFKTLVE